MRRLPLAGLALSVAALLLVSGAAAHSSSPPCVGKQLSGAFAAIKGSAGAGNVSYRLVLRNSSKAACFVSGIPQLTLIGRRGKRLPTAARAEHPGMLMAIRVDLHPGGAAALEARSSPDVPGPGEQQLGRCEPIATRVRVIPNGGGSALLPLLPPTSVCEHGAMSLSLLGPR